MNPTDFHIRISEHPTLSPAGGDEATGEVFIRNEEIGDVIALPVQAIIDNPWEELEAVMLGRREGRLMQTMSRVVGYYSQVGNWNRSKLAELADRRKGDYALDGPGDPDARRLEDITREDLPAELVEAAARGGASMVCEVRPLSGKRDIT